MTAAEILKHWGGRGKIKVLGLNFGRINGECKKYLNIALEEAKAAGAETEIIDTVTKKINRCIGCGACSRMLESGKQQIRCIQKDDYEAISDAVLDADCIIVAAPVYVLGPVGQLKDFVDRFGPRFPCNAHRHPRESRIPIIQNTSCILGTFSSTVIPRFNTDAAIIGKTAFFDPCTVSPP